MFDWRMGGAIVGRITGFCSSSVLLRLTSPEGILPGLGAVGRWLASSSRPLLGGLAGFGCGGLMDRPNVWIDPRREAGRPAPSSPL